MENIAMNAVPVFDSKEFEKEVRDIIGDGDLSDPDGEKSLLLSLIIMAFPEESRDKAENAAWRVFEAVFKEKFSGAFKIDILRRELPDGSRILMFSSSSEK